MKQTTLSMAQKKTLSIREEAHRAGRELSARSVMFYTLVAKLIGLSISDLRAWDLLVSYGRWLQANLPISLA